MDEDEYLEHYGIRRRSGRYPYGSGRDERGPLPWELDEDSTPAQRSKSFFDHMLILKKQGMTESEIAKSVGLSINDLRATRTIANNELKRSNIARAQKLKDEGNSNMAVSREMGIPESSVRALLKEGEQEKADILQTVSDKLRENVDEHGYIDVGKGVENRIGVSKERLGVAVSMLKEEGYSLETIAIDQQGTGNNKTLTKVLA